MLQKDASNRPTTDELLAMPMIVSRAKQLCPHIFNTLSKGNDKLLKTIYVPKYHRDTQSKSSKKNLREKDSAKLDHFIRYLQQSLPQPNYTMDLIEHE